MIIEIGEAFQGFEGGDWDEYIPAIGHLLDAFVQGWHLLAIDRAIALRLASMQIFSARHRAILETQVAEKAAILGGQAKSSAQTILCVPNGYAGLTQRPNQAPVELSWFGDLENCQRVKLLVENAFVDGVYFKNIVEKLGRDIGVSDNLALDVVHGGGSSTPAIFEQLVDDGRPVVCIVDSDKKDPAHTLGDVAQGVLDVNLNSDLVKSYILPVRTIENTVPFSFLFDVYEGNGDVLTMVGQINLIRKGAAYTARGWRMIDHFNLKGGEKRKHILARTANHQADMKFFVDQIVGDVCSLDGDADEQLCGGISSDLMSSTLSYLAAKPWKWSDFVKKFKASPLWPEIEGPLRMIAAFGAAGRRIPI